ncbi:MAG: ribosome silencing factor [Victivallales bacterium]|nr:ribosome silencing factor [Victivallales bacterium]
MEKDKKVTSPKELAVFCARVADDRKAENIVTLEMGEASSIADYFVLCTANSQPHLKAVTDRIERETRNQLEIRALRVEGTPESQWLLLDYGAVVIHVMTPEMRDLYQLESLWGDAPRIEAVKALAQGPAAEPKL